MSKKKDPKNTIVTLIEDPYGLNTLEISDAQNNPEELDIDLDSESHSAASGGKSADEEDDEEDGDADEFEDEEDDDDAGEDEEEESSPAVLAAEIASAETLAGAGESNAEHDDTDAELPPELEIHSEGLENQLEKLAQAMAVQAEVETEAPTETNPEIELAAQIAEDQALEREEEKNAEEALIAQLQARAQAQTESNTDNAANSESAGPRAQVVMDSEEIQSCIEAILFISDKPLSSEKLRGLLGQDFEMSLFQEAITTVQKRYQAIHHGIELAEIAGGYQFRTKPGRAALAQKLVRVQTQRLSTGGMESLAIVAYKQPIMKEEVDKIRGVDSSYFIRGLLEKKLIKIAGRSELPGRPILYTTTDEFLQLFGLKDLSSLPSLRELEQMIPSSQSSNPADEDPKTREMRRLVAEMKADKSSALHYNPKEDEKILKEIKDNVGAIPTSTPYLDALKAAEIAAKEALLHPPVPPGAPTDGAAKEAGVSVALNDGAPLEPGAPGGARVAAPMPAGE
jgi:segregation and condensation protein B